MSGRRRAALGTALAVVIAACGSSSASPAPTPLLLPTFDTTSVHQFPDLEHRLPQAVSGVALESSSYRLDAGEDPGDVPFLMQLVAAGHQATDLRIATAGPSDGATDIVLLAFSMPGVSGADLQNALVSAVSGSTEPTTIGGKNVIRMTEDGTPSYAWVGGDVLFVVGGSDDLVEAALTALS